MKKFSFGLLIIIFLANSVFAWDEIGHKLTAYVAWERMTPEVREKVFKILMDAPEDSDLNVPYDFFNSRSPEIKKRELFMYAAIWSDVIKNRSFEVRYKNYNQSDWHYGDIFWKQENGKATILADFPEESGKAIPKLYDFEKILSDTSYKNEEKSIALAWFLHVGGDIHNPLHNASKVTELDPKGDQGGNRFALKKPNGEKGRTNLHSYWDGIIGDVIPRKNDACDSDYLSPIAKKMMKKYPFAKMQNRLGLSDYKAWNLEGFNFLNEVVYNDIAKDQLPSKKYQKRAFDTSSEQIVLAGYRLGETLNRIFSPNAENLQDKSKPMESQQNALAIWTKVKSVIDDNKPFKFIKLEIKDSTVILNGIVGSLELKQKAIQTIKNVEGVKSVVDLLEVDESISLEKSENTLANSGKSEQIMPPSCKIIRKVLYPVSQRRTPEQKLRIALLDICPPDKGMVARPMMGVIIAGEPIMFEYDVIKVFENEAEAKKYADENEIIDISYE